MYQMNDIEMMRGHHQALLEEAEGERLGWRLREARSKKRPRSEQRITGGFEEESWLQILWSTGPVP